jgi:phosphatidylinositol glycan class O
LHVPFSMLTFEIVFLFFMGKLGLVEEEKVASFLLATTGIVKLRYSIMKKRMLLEVR